MNQPTVPVIPNIVIENLRLQADAFEVGNLRLQLEDAREQNRALEADKQRLTNEKADAEQALGNAERRMTGLEARARDLERREEQLERNIKRLHEPQPAMLFNILGPMLRSDSIPEEAPDIIEVEIHKPNPSTPNYYAVEKFDINTVTNEKISKRPTLTPHTSNPWSVRLTCRSRDMQTPIGQGTDARRRQRG